MILLLVFIFIYPVLMIFQGFDITDNGYMMTAYKYFFSNPAEVGFTFVYWLTCFIGGVWLRVFGGLGLFGVRLFGVIVTWLTMYLTYATLRKTVNHVILLIGLSVILVFTFTYCRMFEYNRLSAALYMLSAFFMYSGLTGRKSALILLSGLVIGINVFARISNICGIALILCVALYCVLYGKPLKYAVSKSLLFVLGFALGVSAVVCLMRITSTGAAFWTALEQYFEIGASAEYSHGIAGLVNLLLIDIKSALIYGALLIVAVFALFFIYKVTSKRLNGKTNGRFADIFFFVAGVVLCAAGYCLLLRKYPEQNLYAKVIKAVNGGFLFLAVKSIVSAIKNRNNCEIALSYFIGMIILFVTPLGSDNGMFNSIFGMWLIGTLSINDLVLLSEKHKNTIAIVVISVFFIYSLTFAYKYNFRESEVRLSLKYPLSDEKFKLIYTNERRAQLFDQMTDEIIKNTVQGEKIIVVGSAPMLYYATETLPLIHNSWTELYTKEQLKHALAENTEEKASYPTIVVLNFNTNDGSWPTGNYEAYRESYTKLDYYSDISRVIGSGYTKVNSQIEFDIFTK